ncbi:S41 family peptidase [Sphaerotilus mobilis]|uniref:S41 family peptidase n=1 Tax=Sphaerotilus mobilis TaxID=47994 RepID=UPI001F5EF7FA|nr:S41 family peptidase [Sphaerotilus mobilis]
MVLIAATLAACGGGGGGGGGGSNEAAPPPCPAWDNTGSGVDTRGVTVTQLGPEQAWVKSMMEANYLWPDEISNIDANASAYADAAEPYASLVNYFKALLSNVTGRDRYSYATTAQASDAYYAGDQTIGSGISWHYDAVNDTLQVEKVEPDSPVGRQGLIRRGDMLLKVDGVRLSDTRQDETSTRFYRFVGAVEANTTCRSTMQIYKAATGAVVDVLVDSASYTPNPVPAARVLNLSASDRVGYLPFDQHILSAEAPLTDAIRSFRAAQVKDVVVDLRYNGGGYLFIANGLAHALAGDARTSGRMFTRLQFSARHAAVADGERNTPFVTTSCLPNPTSFRCTNDTPLPTLGLRRVYVLAGSRTCSASEALVNGLRGIGVQVILVGETTCGKPYGFKGHRRNGIVYFPIEFQIANDLGHGDYADGLQPDCAAADDRWHERGDTREALLSTALAHRATGRCPATTTASAARAGAASLSEAWHEQTPAQARRVSPLQENANARPVWR